MGRELIPMVKLKTSHPVGGSFAGWPLTWKSQGKWSGKIGKVRENHNQFLQVRKGRYIK